jgi:subtilisin family serine protease
MRYPCLVLFLAALLAWVANNGPAERSSASQDAAPPDVNSRPVNPADLRKLTAALNTQSLRDPGGPARRQGEEKVLAGWRDNLKTYTVVEAEFRSDEACQNFVDNSAGQGVTVFHRYKRFADVFVENQMGLDALVNAVGLRWLDMGETAVVPPPPGQTGKEGKTLAVPDKIVQGGFDANTKGAGVIIAIVDTGVDFRNADFITYDKDKRPTSRLLFFWDTLNDHPGRGGPGGPAPFSYPNKRSIGTLYTQKDLTDELRSGSQSIPFWDSVGHGTGCAGIAAGNGNNQPDGKRYAGVAPEADIIAVRIGDRRSLGNVYLLNAVCDWLDGKAKELNKPLVVSCSFGGHRGGHDGCLICERQLDERFAPDTPGRAICIAAGNDGDAAIHAEGKLAPQKTISLSYSSPGNGEATFYFDAPDPSDLRITGAGLKRLTVYTHPLSHARVSIVELFPGEGQLRLENTAARTVPFDAYIAGEDRTVFAGELVSFRKQISTPGTTGNALTVGSYDWNDEFSRFGNDYTLGVGDPEGSLTPLIVGELSFYSNPGPRRNGGATKPDIVAPGEWFTASASANTAAIRDSSNRYQLFNGTSAATPYAAGVVALVMQVKPNVTVAELKVYLKQCATTNAATKQKPESWGNGKLDYAAVERLIRKVRGGNP